MPCRFGEARANVGRGGGRDSGWWMNRRAFLAAGAALATVPRVAFADADDLRTAAREAWLYCLPLVTSARLRAATLAAGGQVNAFWHQREPWAPGALEIGGPESDLLYSQAWINLSDGPVTVRVPPAGGRYVSVTLLTMYGDVLGSLDASDDDLAAATLLGPPKRMGVSGYTVPAPRLPQVRRVIKSRSPWIWALARTAFAGPDDLDGAHAVQDALEVRGRGGGKPPVSWVGLSAPWSDYFFAGQQLIEENPPPPYEETFFRRIAGLQLGIGGGFERARFADADLDAIAQGVVEAKVLASGRTSTNGIDAGWRYPADDLGDFGQDFLYRAQVALAQPGTPKADEVLCLRAVTSDGDAVFDSAPDYRLSLPGPPPSARWSLSLYELRDDGRLFPTRNPLERYAIGSSTPNLRRGPGGEIDVWIGRDDPGANHGANWLPAPAGAPFALLLRAYRPGPDLIQRRFRPSPVEGLSPLPPPPLPGPRPRPRRR